MVGLCVVILGGVLACSHQHAVDAFVLALLVKERKGGGLAKSWSQRVRINGKASDVGLGRYPIVPLA